MDDVARAIRQRDTRAIVSILFDASVPEVRHGFKSETDLWDYKVDVPDHKHVVGWAEIAKDVLAFHNHMGGVLVLAIDDGFRFVGATTRYDSKMVNDKLRRWLGDRLWVEYSRECIQRDQRYLGVLLVPPRGPTLERFHANGPEYKGRLIFEKGESAIRRGDSTHGLTRKQAGALARSIAVPTVGRVYEVDEPFVRILSPDYDRFVWREGPCREVEAALGDRRTAVTAITGIGGVGKTALATWAVTRAYERSDFDFIVATTAKDRELTRSGIQALTPGLSSFESLLDSIAEVLQFPDLRQLPTEQKEREVRDLIANTNGLLYVDNLETVDDARLIAFLDDLPVRVRGITTSRRASVRVAIHPVDLGPLSDREVVDFIAAAAEQPGMAYAHELSEAEAVRIGDACDKIALAIRWTLSRSNSASEALATAESITQSGRRGEELLEFTFRRVFDSMTAAEKAILQVLSLFEAPLPTEALVVGAGRGSSHQKLLDAIERLREDALVSRLFDSNLNDYTYTVLPVTRAFVYTQVASQGPLEAQIRTTLSDYFEAKDVKDVDQRVVVREVRQGKEQSEVALIDLAQGAERRGDLASAESLYEQALARNPRSWKAARLFGEFHRHKRNNIGKALQLYDQAAGNAPSRGSDRALIYRERGMLLRGSGLPDATRRALENFEIALEEAPNDALARHALGHMLCREGHHRRAIEVLEPLLRKSNAKTLKATIPLLHECYTRLGEFVRAAEIKARAEDSGIQLR
jgi:tetratricopeptide (TPR) repeat protein